MCARSSPLSWSDICPTKGYDCTFPILSNLQHPNPARHDHEWCVSRSCIWRSQDIWAYIGARAGYLGHEWQITPNRIPRGVITYQWPVWLLLALQTSSALNSLYSHGGISYIIFIFIYGILWKQEAHFMLHLLKYTHAFWKWIKEIETSSLASITPGHTDSLAAWNQYCCTGVTWIITDCLALINLQNQ